MAKKLQQLLVSSSDSFPSNIAVDLPGVGKLTYKELNNLSSVIASKLFDFGVSVGDRVGICAKKSPSLVAAIFGILKADAAYVPVDSTSPAARNAFIFTDCSVKCLIIDSDLIELFKNEFAFDFKAKDLFAGLTLIYDINYGFETKNLEVPSSGDLSYILYTSGSTGKPKGVMYSHSGALAFIDWCSSVFFPTEKDIFSSHAPFYFDLSILDLYLSIKHGGKLVLISEDASKQPLTLTNLIAESKISIWYSTPSILSMMLQFGKIDRFDNSSLRIVLFAGEVFPIKYLKSLKDVWKHADFYNLYGPTETNVCTYFKVPEIIEEDREEPFPIGKKCSHYECKVMKDDHKEVVDKSEGELYAKSQSVMLGYWNLSERNKNAFYVDDSGQFWYKTGDIVRENDVGDYLFIGRKDRMVKRRGYRIELGEIESALYNNNKVNEAAVVSINSENGTVIKVFISLRVGEESSFIEMKKYCVENLPNYMIPDKIIFLNELPKTGTDKMDYQSLKKM